MNATPDAIELHCQKCGCTILITAQDDFSREIAYRPESSSRATDANHSPKIILPRPPLVGWRGLAHLTMNQIFTSQENLRRNRANRRGLWL